MKNITSHYTGHSIYPGEYAPLYEVEEIEEEIKRHDIDGGLINVMMNEQADAFIIKMVIPGVKREDFVITADDNILSVYVLHKEYLRNEGNFQSGGSGSKCFSKKIILPDNTDTEFILAQYVSGVLSLYILKAELAVKNHHTTAVVY